MSAILGVIGALVVAVVVIGLVLGLLGLVFGVVAGLLGLTIKLLPLLLVGWVVVKLIQRAERKKALGAADRHWLDSRR